MTTPTIPPGKNDRDEQKKREEQSRRRLRFAVGYFITTRNALVLSDVMTGVVKSFVFGLIITAVGCQEGFSTGAGAEEVGRSTTSAVVISILMVILVDVVFTALFYLTGGLT